MKTIELLRFRLSLIACLSAFLGLAAQTGAQVPALPSGVQPSQWRLVWTESPSTTALISRSTKDAGDEHKVHYAIKGRLDQSREVRCQRNGRYTDQAGDKQLYYHHARLTGLEPGMADRGHHVQLLTFTPDELQYRCVLLGGEVLDRHVLAPRQ